MATGDATWDAALMLFLERSGYREETYHTFSYSPLTDDDGRVAGMFCVVSEDTERVISARHLATVRDVSAHVTALRSETEVVDAAARQLSEDRWSVPFGLVYLLADDSTSAVLGGVRRRPGRASGGAAGHRPRGPGRALAGG